MPWYALLMLAGLIIAPFDALYLYIRAQKRKERLARERGDGEKTPAAPEDRAARDQRPKGGVRVEALTFRFAQAEDAALILRFIRALAEYENMLDEVVATEELLKTWIFDRQKAEVLFAVADGREVGFALFFHNFSTFLGRAGIYLEDLYVLPEYRGQGCGRGLLRQLARIALERGCGRLEWWCLDWNRPSIDFYRALGARPMDDWTVYRIDGETLKRLAE